MGFDKYHCTYGLAIFFQTHQDAFMHWNKKNLKNMTDIDRWCFDKDK